MKTNNLIANQETINNQNLNNSSCLDILATPYKQEQFTMFPDWLYEMENGECSRQ